MKKVRLGINEKALPAEFSWEEKFQLVKSLGFSFIELSIDESDERIQRLEWTKEESQQLREISQRFDIQIKTIMLSALRKYPLGSADPGIYRLAYGMARQAIILAKNLGYGTVQLAGYDEYYLPKSSGGPNRFYQNLERITQFAAREQVMVTVETMDDKFINTVQKVAELKMVIKSPWLAAYADLGNLTAWQGNNPKLVAVNLKANQEIIAAIHVKDTKPVTNDFPGVFKDVSLGEGTVNFDYLFNVLYRSGYQGTFTIELWTERAVDCLKKLQLAKDFVTEKLEAAGYEITVS